MAISGIMVIATNNPHLPSKLRLFYGKVSPARHALDANGDDREVVEHHRAILGVARAQQGLRAVVLGAVAQDLGRSTQHDPAKPGPIFVPAVGDKGGDGVFGDVPKALQRPDVALRLLVDRDVDGTFADDKAYRYEMRGGPGIGGREMAHSTTGEKPGLLFGQHGEMLPDFGGAGQTPRAVASSARDQTDEAGHEDRAHRPSEPDRRRYRSQHRVLQARARHAGREHG